jgi:hypothetical protein
MPNQGGNSTGPFDIPRRGRRYPLILPLRVLVRKIQGRFSEHSRRPSETITENISSTGCYFLLDREIGIRDRVEMEILIPPMDENSPAGLAVCRGRVVRVEPKPESGKVGVACTIDHYRLTASERLAWERGPASY